MHNLKANLNPELWWEQLKVARQRCVCLLFLVDPTEVSSALEYNGSRLSNLQEFAVISGALKNVANFWTQLYQSKVKNYVLELLLLLI